MFAIEQRDDGIKDEAAKLGMDRPHPTEVAGAGVGRIIAKFQSGSVEIAGRQSAMR